MKTNLLNFWETLRASYWFLPAVMTGLAVALSFLTISIDQSLGTERSDLFSWFYAGDPGGVRTLLSTLAGSMITMVSVTFSITIVALTMASSQFGPRLLDNFFRDAGNQVVLGTFIATFIYSLLVLRVVRSEIDAVFVPHFSVSTAVLLTIASLGLLIFFIHHASVSIHVQNVIASVEKELNTAIERLFPEKKSEYDFEYHLRNKDDVPDNFDQDAFQVLAKQSGYLQTVNYQGLIRLACQQNLLLRLERRPGDFIAPGSVLLKIWPRERFDEQESEQVHQAFKVGARRTRLQDVEFAVDQLVELAVRALSPGINDPFTAMACIDRLGAALAQLAGRRIPSGYRYDQENILRLIADPVTFEGLVESAFNQIRQHGRSSVVVTLRLLETIALIAGQARSQTRQEALLEQAEMIRRGSEGAIFEDRDRRDIDHKYQLVERILKQTG